MEERQAERWSDGNTLAEARVFDHAPGMVARCPGRGQVLVRLVRGPRRLWLDLGGLAYLQAPLPEQT